MSRVPLLSSIVMVALVGSNMTLGKMIMPLSIKVNVSLFSHTASSTMVIVRQCRRTIEGGSNAGRTNGN